MKSRVPQSMMKTFGYKKRKNRSMTFSLVGLAASAAAAFALKNGRSGMRKFLQTNDLKGGFKSAFNRRPTVANWTEFAREFASGINNFNGKYNANEKNHNHSSSRSESSELMNQLAMTASQPGKEQEVKELAEKFIKKNM